MVNAAEFLLKMPTRCNPKALSAAASAVDLPQFTGPIAIGIGQYPNASTMLSYARPIKHPAKKPAVEGNKEWVNG